MNRRLYVVEIFDVDNVWRPLLSTASEMLRGAQSSARHQYNKHEGNKCFRVVPYGRSDEPRPLLVLKAMES